MTISKIPPELAMGNIPARKSISKKTKHAIWNRDNWTCRYCGLVCDEAWQIGDNNDYKASIDHVIPFAFGGTHTEENLVTACLYCNNAKGRRTPDQWYAAICARYDHDETRL